MDISTVNEGSETTYNVLFNLGVDSKAALIKEEKKNELFKYYDEGIIQDERKISIFYDGKVEPGEEIKFENALTLRGISKMLASKKIKETITKANTNSESLKSLGYSVFTRNLENDMYKPENVTIFFFGENANLYVLYPYGNTSETSEMDIIILK